MGGTVSKEKQDECGERSNAEESETSSEQSTVLNNSEIIIKPSDICANDVLLTDINDEGLENSR